MTTLKFGTPHSIVDSSFFQKLSELKLNDYKLDSSSKTIYGSFAYTSIGKDQGSVLSLNDSSFKERQAFSEILPTGSSFITTGSLHNQNTIEDFKKINKSEFIKSEAQLIFDAILDKSVLDKPSDLNKFSVLSFSDLKKYKFFYWVNFPQLHSEWTITEEKQADYYKDIIPKLLNSGEQFFVMKEDDIYPLQYLNSTSVEEKLVIGVISTSSIEDRAPWELRNLLTALSVYGYREVQVFIVRPQGKHSLLSLKNDEGPITHLPKTTGWERTNEGKLGPKLADLGSLIDPVQLADQAVDLNLKLMKWRISPKIDLDIIKNTKCLLLGAGTLGSYVGRALLGWGFQDITFVDNGKVSFSNPVRQPLFKFEDCLNGGAPKAAAAANALKEIYPSVKSKGYDLEVPMAGHPITNESKQQKDFDKLNELIEQHDAIFLLMDSRETRWLPTVIANAKGKIVINAALGFDSYLVMRHGCVKSLTDESSSRLGCYFCNDVVAPADSLTDRTLDQMCTVTRPGVALIASGLAVELLVSVLQHEDKQFAPSSVDPKDKNSVILGSVPHQIRGYLHNFNNISLEAPNYQYCSACSLAVINGLVNGGWDFVKNVLNDSKILEELTGLAEVQRKAEEIDLNFDITDDEDDDEFM